MDDWTDGYDADDFFATDRWRRSSRRLRLLTGVALLCGLALATWLLVGGSLAARAWAAAFPPEQAQGDPGALVTVEEWGDFQCAACRDFSQTVEQQLEETAVATGQVRLTWRNFAVLGRESTWAAEAADCAAEQDRFWDYHDRLLVEQAGRNSGVFDKPHLERYAAELGLVSRPFNDCLESDRYSAHVLFETEAGHELGVQLAPTFLVHGPPGAVTPLRVEGLPTLEHVLQLADTIVARAELDDTGWLP